MMEDRVMQIEIDAITAQEAAELLRVSTWRVYELCREGHLPHVRLGRTVRLSRTAVLAQLRGDKAASGKGARTR